MIISDFVNKNGYEILTSNKAAETTSIKGVYVCDMLSHAMAKVKDGDVWITVHTNINIVAVAHLTNSSCIVIPESIKVDDITLNKAEEQNVIIISAPDTSYEICIRYYTQSGGTLS